MTPPHERHDVVGSRVRARSGAVAAGVVALMLLSGIAALAVGLPSLQLRTWLVVLFQINADVGSLPARPLRVFNPLDVIVLILTSVTIMAVWSLIPRPSRAWLLISVTLPFFGIALLIATHLAGRSALMGAGLVIASFMARSSDTRRMGYLGFCANGLLLVGDIATGEVTGPFVAALVAVGYLLLLAWFALIGARLLHVSQAWVGG
jgi:hypothetical protein